jgi:hypothetical protein
MKTTIASAVALLVAAGTASAVLPTDQDHPRHGVPGEPVTGQQVEIETEALFLPEEQVQTDAETVTVTRFEGKAESETPR